MTKSKLKIKRSTFLSMLVSLGSFICVYGFLMKKKLITPDEYHILRGNRILDEEAKEEENNDNENE